ncbi:lipocalin-like domain-containing protein [Sphingobacterium wenxiniae]|uniref:Lipocalin-like domain-containing protein n=1 Tax=Sphingobacterium wenxiniae TaxID=683125 RepID=A0A1I6TKA0_9SPHI|nr:lipocalin family protein [Sphingobacterium wenxiniae]SFS89594.1 Lipocalin-like domain-containing protein [Sphingobacterium wenxiniae]
MKTLKHLFALAMLLCAFVAEAQFFEKVGKSAEKAAERTVLRKTEQKTSEKVGKTIDRAVDGDPAKKREKQKRKKEQQAQRENNSPQIGDVTKYTGKWYYVSETGKPEDNCQAKSYFTFSGSNYTHLLYSKDCTPVSGSSGTFNILENRLILVENGKKTGYSVLSLTDRELILKDDQAHIITLKKE